VSTRRARTPSGSPLKLVAGFTGSGLRESRSSIRAHADGAARAGADDTAMDDTLICQKGAWRRENAKHHYTGSISASPDGLRLAGRDQVTGIQVTLSIPSAEIGGVRLSSSWEEQLVGERCVVLELYESTPILLRPVGAHADPVTLASRIAALVHPSAVG
jgi:hypothetical protein